MYICIEAERGKYILYPIANKSVKLFIYQLN